MINLAEVVNSGIYQIVNTQTGKRYIGSARLLNRRKRRHFASLAQNRHPNAKLQNAWNKYGADSFIFEVISFCNPDELIGVEQKFIDEFNSVDEGYNIAIVAGSVMAGRNHTAESKFKISRNNAKSMLGKTLTEEQKQKVSQANIGNRNSAGRVYTEAQRQNQIEKLSGRVGCNKGKKFSAQARERMSLGQLGKKRSAEHIANAIAGKKAKRPILVPYD